MHNRPVALIKAGEKVIASLRHLGPGSARDQWWGSPEVTGRQWVTRRDTLSARCWCWLGPINVRSIYICFRHRKVVSVLLLSVRYWIESSECGIKRSESGALAPTEMLRKGGKFIKDASESHWLSFDTLSSHCEHAFAPQMRETELPPNLLNLQPRQFKCQFHLMESGSIHASALSLALRTQSAANWIQRRRYGFAPCVNLPQKLTLCASCTRSLSAN